MAAELHPRLLASIELNGLREDRPHGSAPDVRVRLFDCGCQLNDRGGTITNVWLCQYHDGFSDALDLGGDDLYTGDDEDEV